MVRSVRSGCEHRQPHMNATVEAGLIAAVATLAGALGTQALSNHREAARRRAEVDQKKIEEIRNLYEDAARNLLSARRLTREDRPPDGDPSPYVARNLEAATEVEEQLRVIDTRLRVRIPSIDQQIGRWRLTLQLFRYSRSRLELMLREIRSLEGSLPTDRQVASFDKALSELQSSAGAFENSVASTSGFREQLGSTRRERMWARTDTFGGPIKE